MVNREIIDKGGGKRFLCSGLNGNYPCNPILSGYFPGLNDF